MLLELHAHTSKHSACSNVDPVALVKKIVAKGIQGLVLTDHCYLWSPQEIEELRKLAEVDSSFFIFPGQEAETDIGHVLVFGADRSLTGTISIDDLKREYPEAALVWAHPFRSGKMPAEDRILDPRIDALEIFSNNHSIEENYRGLLHWHRYKFTATSGSDTHDISVAGKLPTQFDHPVKNANELALEIKGGRCRPFFKEIPRAGSNIVVTEITLGTKGDDEVRDRIIVKKVRESKKWRKMRRSADFTEKLRAGAFGGPVYRVPRMMSVNEEDMSLMEEGQRGKRLFDLMGSVSPSIASEYVKLAAKWLARFHDAGIFIDEINETVEKESNRFERYGRIFNDTHSPYLKEMESLIAWVAAEEERMLLGGKDGLVQNHGDFHPKNIIIGQDLTHDIGTLFISVIDFDSSILMPRAFDVGYFIAQLRNQVSGYPELLSKYESDFLNSYIRSAANNTPEFMAEVAFFTVRANLSIASFLVKVGKGESPEMHKIVKRSLELKAAAGGIEGNTR
ncbi:MAG: phosphotransferase [Candidatus Omnitrophica bacterium]|nr:phosphotransferase [Candidatus Omnitrophota bacterium]